MPTAAAAKAAAPSELLEVGSLIKRLREESQDLSHEQLNQRLLVLENAFVRAAGIVPEVAGAAEDESSHRAKRSRRDQ